MQTVSTQNHYRARALQLINRAEKERGQRNLSAQQVVQWLIDQRSNYSKSTWRQYRASLIFLFVQYIESGIQKPDGLADAIVRLQQTPPPSGRAAQRKTSAQKLKKLQEADLVSLLNYFDSRTSRHGLATMTWLLAGLWAGLRPCEWETAFLNAENQLIIKNAKATNGRSHGETRTIALSELEPQELLIIRQQLCNVQQAKLDPGQNGKSGFELYYHHCRTCLYEANRALWPKRKRFISLYSARHQFAADAKLSGLSLEHIAALMGHRSIETASEHYGRRSAGNRGLKVIANSDDVARVELLNQHRADKSQQGLRM